MKQPNSIRRVAFAVTVLFLLSWVFPIGAALAKDTSRFPKWWGLIDVSLAFVLAIAAFALQTLMRGRVDRQAEEVTYRVYRALTHGIMLLALLVMLAGDRIAWHNCGTGFLWRSWLGLYLLPWWLATRRPLNAPAPDRPSVTARL